MNTIFKTRTTNFFYILILVILVSCNKGNDITPTQPKCRLSRVKLLPDGRNIDFTYNSQGQLISYKNAYAYIFSTFEYDSKGNMVKLLEYNDEYANSKSLITEYGCKYDDKSNLLEISTESKGLFSGIVLYSPVTVNSQKQVTSIKNGDGSKLIFEYDSKGNMIKTYIDRTPMNYLQYEFDDKKNPYQDLPWLFKYLYRGIFFEFGVNNGTIYRQIGPNTAPSEIIFKYEYNTDGFPISSVGTRQFNNFQYEYKCE
jgi:YD repeat-containing protein